MDTFAIKVHPEETEALTWEREDDLAQRIDDAIEGLAQDLSKGFTQNYLDFLNFWAGFHRYSAVNTILIMVQKPNSRKVAGFNKWKALGYKIRKGVRACYIWCPIIVKQENPDTLQVEEVCVSFRPCPVFGDEDLIPEDAQRLPDGFIKLADDCSEQYQQIKAQVIKAGFAVTEAKLRTGTDGMSNKLTGAIQIREDMDSRNQVLTLLHELCHSLAHRDEDTTREQKEFEAESVATVIGRIWGIDNPSGHDYLLGWKATPEQLRSSMPRIHSLIKQVLKVLDPAQAIAA